MMPVLLQMAALIACGVVWRAIRPFQLDADTVRRSITTLVYVLLLPALVLDVLWRAPLGLDSGRLALSAAAGVLLSLAAAWFAYRLRRAERPLAGAMILAAGFPNATYLGLPVLEQLLGSEGRSIAIQYDLFACTPLLLTVGMLVARHHGTTENGGESPLQTLLKTPPLWAAVIAIGLNLGGVPRPEGLHPLLAMLGNPVAPLMLISLGLGLQWASLQPTRLPALLPALAIQLLLMPLIVWTVASATGLNGNLLTGAVLEAAMPSMVIGLVICDRYNLDTPAYAAAVTLSTLLSLVTLPLWFGWVA